MPVNPLVILVPVGLIMIGLAAFFIFKTDPRPAQAKASDFTPEQLAMRKVITSAIIRAWWAISFICIGISFVIGLIYAAATH